MKFITITDTTSETFYINKECVAYLKESVSVSQRSCIYKVVLTNDKQILIANQSDFERIKKALGVVDYV
jgi:hypothetical protein